MTLDGSDERSMYHVFAVNGQRAEFLVPSAYDSEYAHLKVDYYCQENPHLGVHIDEDALNTDVGAETGSKHDQALRTERELQGSVQLVSLVRNHVELNPVDERTSSVPEQVVGQIRLFN